MGSIRYKSVSPKQAYLGSVVWFHDRNPRQDAYGESHHLIGEGRLFMPSDKVLQKDIVQNFVTLGGWDSQQPLVAQRLSSDDHAEAIRRLELEYDRLRGEAADSGDMLPLQTFRYIYCDQKGNIQASQLLWQGVTGNRRGSQLINSFAAIVKLNKNDFTVLDHCELPILVPNNKEQRFVDDDQRITEALLENTLKAKGAKVMTPYDILRSVYKLIVEGNRSNGWVEKNMGITGSDRVIYTGWARFLHYCEIEMDWGLGLWEKLNPRFEFLRDETGNFILQGEERVPNPEFINMKNFGQLAWQGPTASDHPYKDVAMGAMTDLTKDLDKFNREREGKKASVTRPGRQYVVDWLAYFNDQGNKGASKKIMQKADIERMQKSHPIKIGRLFAKAIYDSDSTKLIEASQKEFGYNWIFDCPPEVYEVFAELLKTVKKPKLNNEEAITVWQHLQKTAKEAIDACVLARTEVVN